MWLSLPAIGRHVQIWRIQVVGPFEIPSFESLFVLALRDAAFAPLRMRTSKDSKGEDEHPHDEDFKLTDYPKTKEW